MASASDLLQDLLLLSRATQLILLEHVLEGIGENGVNPPRASILRLLRRQGPQSVNAIAGFLGQTRAAGSQNVEWLVRAGLVDRRTNTQDRRSVQVSITDAGRAIIERAEERQLSVLKKAMEGVGVTDPERLAGAMRSLAVALLEHSEAGSDYCLHCCSYDSAACVEEGGSWHCAFTNHQAPR